MRCPYTVRKFAALSIIFETESLSQQHLRTTTTKNCVGFFLLLLFYFWGAKKHLIYSMCLCVESWIKKKKKPTQVAQKSSFLVLDFIWERNSGSRPSSFSSFPAPSPPQGEVWVRVSKEGKGASSAFVSANRQLSLVLCHFVFSFPCYLVGLVLCWIEEDRR